MWTVPDSGGSLETASINVWDRATNTVLTTFPAGRNAPAACGDGRVKGVAYDPTDGNLWVSFYTGGRCGDDFIHKMPAMGGPDIATIPDPTVKAQTGALRGIGALDYDPEENVLYALAYAIKRVYKLDPKNGNILREYDFSDLYYIDYHYSLSIVRPPELGGKKVLLVLAGWYLDIDTGQFIRVPPNVYREGVGYDEDEITGNMIYNPDRVGDISLEDGHRCDCEVIEIPQPQVAQSNWPDPENRLNWSMNVEVSDNDGLVLRNVKLGQRYMAEKISVPYYTLETSAFPKQRAELKPDSDDPTASSRLINYRVFTDDQKLIIEATYLVDQIPSTSKSCLHVTQRYEFYKEGVGGPCEPSEKLPCSRWKPIVKYQFFGQGETLTTINIAQRQYLRIDNNRYNTIGLFKDCDGAPPPLGLGCGFNGIIFDRKINPLFDETYDLVISQGKSTNQWDNIHQTYMGEVDEPGIDLTLQNWSLKRPGCPECAHTHWRWGASTGGEGGGNIFGIPSGSTQDLEFAIVRNNPGEEDPIDFRFLSNQERIRRPATGYDAQEQMYDYTVPDDVVRWYSGIGYQNSDTFFGFGNFFNSSIPSKQLYGGGGTAPAQSVKTISPSSLVSSESDALTSVVAANLYTDGQTTVTSFDPSVLGPLPQGYTLYNNLSSNVETEAEISGPNIITFSVPSASDQAVFNNLRILHAEQDQFEPDKVVWVDRTILAPDTQAPDFTNRTINAKTRLLGQYVVAYMTAPQPAGAADISIASSHSPSQIVAGNSLTYTFAITNNGPQTATGITFADGLPPNAVFVSAIPSQGNCAQTDGTTICKLNALDIGATASVTVVIKLTEGGVKFPPEGKAISNTAYVRANEGDANLANNIATETTTVLPDSNLAPTVNLTSPSTGNMFVGPANITITAEASGSDGSISRVDFFADGSFIGTGAAAGQNQYSFTWTNARTGSHTLTATSTDNRGATASSNSVTINVQSPALFVVGSTTLTSSDSVIKTRLEALGYVVTVKDGTAAATADANGKAIVVISSTVTPTSVGTKFRAVAVPVVLWESGLYANMGMTGSTNKDFGTATRQMAVNIINPSHPMADGMMGQAGVTNTSNTLSWGKPNANGVSIATVVGDASKVAVFGYEQGAAMPGLTAPARRVGLFMYDTTAADFYGPGQRLFDAAIKWATGRI